MTPIEKALAEIATSKPLAKHAKQLRGLVVPHLRFKLRAGKPADGRPGASRLGGDPDLPEGTPWPLGPGINDDEAPMDFVAQLDCAALATHDDRLPASGTLAFFVAQNYAGGAVIHGEEGSLVRMPTPGRKKKAKPPRWGGFGVAAQQVLPPPWSQLVSSKDRSAKAWNPRTDKRGKLPAKLELSEEAHAAYVEIYEGWLRATGHAQHGMFGYDRMMEAARQVDELVLLRLDYNEFGSYDFVELVSIYWFITPKALAARRFDEVAVYCGSTI